MQATAGTPANSLSDTDHVARGGSVQGVIAGRVMKINRADILGGLELSDRWRVNLEYSRQAMHGSMGCEGRQNNPRPWDISS